MIIAIVICRYWLLFFCCFLGYSLNTDEFQSQKTNFILFLPGAFVGYCLPRISTSRFTAACVSKQICFLLWMGASGFRVPIMFPQAHPAMFRELLGTIRHILVHSDLDLGK